MKNIKTSLFALVFIAVSILIPIESHADECRDIKLACKEEAKQDNEYTPQERSECRILKLECKSDTE